MRLVNPYRKSEARWLKGQLHIHTTKSDGCDAPELVIDDYRKSGYDFISLTDHNICTAPEYLKPDSQMLNIAGCEFRSGKNYPEIGIIGSNCGMPGLDMELGKSVEDAANSGAFVIYNHPNWNFNHWPLRDMLRIRKAHALEVYNRVIDHLAGPSESTDKWDIMLSCGYRIFAVATDDAHIKAGRGNTFVAVRAQKNRKSIVSALKSGNFYASSGVVLKDISLKNGILKVVSENAEKIRFFVGQGTMRKEVSAKSASYEIQTDDVYVRAELYGAKFAKAWTNPVFVESAESEEKIARFSKWVADNLLCQP